jgi:hypothetical protein
VYVSDIKEMAAVLRQDSNEVDVVRTILDGLHPRERNRLVFCERPRNYADLDSMCVYAHNIPSNDHYDITDTGTRRTSSSSSARSDSANPAQHSASVVCFRCNKPNRRIPNRRVFTEVYQALRDTGRLPGVRIAAERGVNEGVNEEGIVRMVSRLKPTGLLCVGMDERTGLQCEGGNARCFARSHSGRP